MTFQIHIALVAIIALTVELDAKAVSLNDAGASVSIGQLYALRETGALHGLHKRDVQSLKKNEQHRIRLRLNDGSPPLDMHLRQVSVWSTNSEFVLRDGDRTFKLPHNRDSNCYLHGQVPSHGGAVTINRCGTLTGNIHIPGYQFQLEEMLPPEGGNEEEEDTKLKVTKKMTEDEIIEKEEIEVLHDMEDEIIEEEEMEVLRDMEDVAILEPVNGDNSTSRVKRETDSITIEVAIFVDKKYHDYLYYDMSITDYNETIQWFVQKWDMVDAIYGAGTDKIGADITIQVRKIEIWRENPENYPETPIGVSPRLKWFCRNTPHANNYDQKVLYTKGTGGHQLGIAYLSGTCRPRINCNLVKSPTENVRVELHELGHNIGFRHDPSIGDCGNVKGFMGWTNTYRYLPCYKRALISQLRKSSMSCLFTKNVPEEGIDDS